MAKLTDAGRDLIQRLDERIDTLQDERDELQRKIDEARAFRNLVAGKSEAPAEPKPKRARRTKAQMLAAKIAQPDLDGDVDDHQMTHEVKGVTE